MGAAVAFTAGLLSFLSPCVLPLIPSYVGYLTGMSVEEVERRRGTALLHALWFVAGFSLVFVLLGAGASAVGHLLRDYQVWLGRVGGVLLILFGLYLLGILRPAFLLRERRIELARKPLGYFGSGVIGFTFGAAWTPCIGPILGGILTLAATQAGLAQGIGLLAFYSLVRVAKGFFLGIAMATPLGFFLGVSPTLRRMLDPVIQVLRPISPLAWLPLGLIIFRQSEPAALFTIAICSMWPTVINTMSGVQSIPQDYWNVAKVLRLSPFKTFTRVLAPAALPHIFTGYRLSLGIAWLVIVASEMLTGTPGVGGFLWQEYNSLVYAHILLCIVTIGIVGFVLDRLMGAVESRLRSV